jgi:hypothetical protein
LTKYVLNRSKGWIKQNNVVRCDVRGRMVHFRDYTCSFLFLLLVSTKINAVPTESSQGLEPINAARESNASTSYTEPTPWSQKTLHACGRLGAAGARYVLEEDVSSPSTCFSIQADQITLDLNGHTITYGTYSPKSAAFGILGIACWDTSLSNGVANGNPCGGSFDNFTVMNGKIVQAQGVAPYSDGIRLGQGGGNHLVVHDVEFAISGDSSIPIHTIESGSGAQVYGNTIRNSVRTIRNRHQLQGMSIKFDSSENLSAGQDVHDNEIEGGAQGGILLATPGATAYRNKIRQNGRYSNDFAIYVWGNNQRVYQNEISTLSGRGIQIGGGAIRTGGHGTGNGARHSEVTENKIEVIELKQNCDYSESNACNVCQLGGAYGIQFDDNPQGDVSSKNEVIARADDCDAAALRVTDSELSQNRSLFDSFAATRLNASSSGKAYGWDNSGPKAFTAKNDQFVGDTASYHVSWDGAESELCESCSFGKGTANPSADYVTFSFENGGTNPVKNIHFIDPKFTGGAAKDSTNMRRIDASNWPGPAEYYIDWTLKLTVVAQNGELVEDAAVAITDRVGNRVYSGQTGPDGSVVTILTEFRMYNTAEKVGKEFRTPHSLTVTREGCRMADADTKLKAIEPLRQRITLNCHGL